MPQSPKQKRLSPDDQALADGFEYKNNYIDDTLAKENMDDAVKQGSRPPSSRYAESVALDAGDVGTANSVRYPRVAPYVLPERNKAFSYSRKGGR